MIKQIAIALLALAAVAGAASAQEPSPTDTLSGREQLAVDSFQRLVDMSSLLDQINLAADLTCSETDIEGHPDLWTPLVENILFDYCNVSDSLKTVENFRATHFDQRKHYTLRSSPQWDELGRLYARQRAELEKFGMYPSPLHLISDPLARGRDLARLMVNKLTYPRRNLAPKTEIRISQTLPDKPRRRRRSVKR